MAQTNRDINLASVKSIMQKRALITNEMVGKLVEAFIQGNGNTIDMKNGNGELVESVVEPGTVARKTIYNLKANSALAMQNERNRNILRAGATAEKTGAKVKFDLGDGEKEYSATELLSTYLNRVQLSFSVVLPSSIVANLGNGVLIKAIVQRIDPTPERKAAEPNAAPVLTIDPSTISLVAAQALSATTFDIDDILGEDEVKAPLVETEA